MTLLTFFNYSLDSHILAKPCTKQYNLDTVSRVLQYCSLSQYKNVNNFLHMGQGIQEWTK